MNDEEMEGRYGNELEYALSLGSSSILLIMLNFCHVYIDFLILFSFCAI